jgi:chromosome segregation ATPase
VNIPDKHRRDGKYVAADELRGEVTKWFTKCQRLEQELQANKAQRHAPLEQQVENLTATCRDKDTANKQLRTQMHKIEGELTSLRNELQTTRRERAELQEKNARCRKRMCQC